MRTLGPTLDMGGKESDSLAPARIIKSMISSLYDADRVIEEK